MTFKKPAIIAASGGAAVLTCAILGFQLHKFMGTKRIEVLCVELNSSDTRVAMRAAISLGRMGPTASAAAPALGEILQGPERALRDGDRSLRAEAAAALVAIGRPAVPYLIKAMKSDEWGVRLRSIDAVRRLGPEARDAIPALVESLFHTDRDTRVTAANALSEIASRSDKEVVRALSEVSQDENRDVAECASAALLKLR